ERLQHARPVVTPAQAVPAAGIDVHAATVPVPERTGGTQRLHQALEVGALTQVAVARQVAREARDEVRLDVGDPQVGAAIQQLPEHLGAGSGIPDDEEWRLRARHSRSGSKSPGGSPAAARGKASSSSRAWNPVNRAPVPRIRKVLVANRGEIA